MICSTKRKKKISMHCTIKYEPFEWRSFCMCLNRHGNSQSVCLGQWLESFTEWREPGKMANVLVLLTATCGTSVQIFFSLSKSGYSFVFQLSNTKMALNGEGRWGSFLSFLFYYRNQFLPFFLLNKILAFWKRDPRACYNCYI